MSKKYDIDVVRSKAYIDAIDRSMMLIEFSPDGEILNANANFLLLMSYSLDEIKGQHHRILLDSVTTNSPEYKSFWASLAEGKMNAGQFKRITKGGEEVWLEATYSPVLDANGQVVQVIKVATDITAKVIADERLVDIAKELDKAMASSKEAEIFRLEMERTLQEMSTPIMPVWEGILLLPLVGVVDSVRTNDVMQKSLEMIGETRSKMFILDISGVPTVDTAVANQLLKVTQATRFMGCETIISGLSPAIARTMVDLGINVGDVRTTANLRDAFRMALIQIGANNKLNTEVNIQ